MAKVLKNFVTGLGKSKKREKYVVQVNDERFKTFALQTLKGNTADFMPRRLRLH